MDLKDQELINKFFKFFRGLSQVIPPLSKEGKSGSPIDIAENAMEFINKMIFSFLIAYHHLFNIAWINNRFRSCSG